MAHPMQHHGERNKKPTNELPTKRQAQRFVEYVEANDKVVFLADNPILELARRWSNGQLVEVGEGTE